MLLGWDEHPGALGGVDPCPVAQDRTELQWLLAVDCTRPVVLLQAARRPLDHIFREGTRRMAASSR